jgi:hypothetical protein
VAFQNSPLEHSAASAGKDAIFSAPAADAFFARVPARESASALKIAWAAAQSDTPEEALPSDSLGLNEVGQTL